MRPRSRSGVRAEDTTSGTDRDRERTRSEAKAALQALLGHSFLSPISAIQIAAQAIERSPENTRLAPAIVRAARQLHRLTIQADVLTELALPGESARSSAGAGGEAGGESGPGGPGGPEGPLAPCVSAAAQGACARTGCELVLLSMAEVHGQWDSPRVALLVDTLVVLAALALGRAGFVEVELSAQRGVTALLRVTARAPDAVVSSLTASLESAYATLPRGYWGENVGVAPFVAQAIARAHGGEIRIDRAGDLLILESAISSAAAAEPVSAVPSSPARS